MKIILFGEDKFSLLGLEALLEAGYEVPLVVTPMNNPTAALLKRQVEKSGIPVFVAEKINDKEMEERLNSLRPDLFFLIHFDRILKKNIFSIPPRGSINIHPSLLPAYRGRTPQQWAIIHDETELGVTTHFVDEGIDTGDIILQEKFEITEDTYIADVQHLLFLNYKRIIKDTMDKIILPDFVPQKQNITSDKIYPKINPENCALSDDNTVTEIHNRIRALSLPYFGAPYQQYRLFKGHILSVEKEREIRTHYDKIGFFPNTKFGAIFVAKNGVVEVEQFTREQ
ncbi:MAG: hypothetical protein LBV02_00615 [Bacteroidales bacterium]|jgi:methionyl-tRNA formyltransferase|nr:hypothetical protein [Bacteroidales bacterium]